LVDRSEPRGYSASVRETSFEIPIQEGFVRRILDRREYMRGIHLPQVSDCSACSEVGAHPPPQAGCWTGDAAGALMKDVIGQRRAHGYAYPIERLMVTSLCALLPGADLKRLHAGYLACASMRWRGWRRPKAWAGAGRRQYEGPQAPCRRQSGHRAHGPALRRVSLRPHPVQRRSRLPLCHARCGFLMRRERLQTGNPRTALQVKNLALLPQPREAMAIRRGEVAGA
jgi:hypothetical protein